MFLGGGGDEGTLGREEQEPFICCALTGETWHTNNNKI